MLLAYSVPAYVIADGGDGDDDGDDGDDDGDDGGGDDGDGDNPFCGDGIINQPREECDDGNYRNGDGCSKKCKLEPNEIPEFTTIGAGLALAGIGAYIYRRRSRK